MKIEIGKFYLGDEHPYCLVYKCVGITEKPPGTWFDNGTIGYLMEGPNPYGYEHIGTHYVDEEGEAGYGTGGVNVVKELTEFEVAQMKKRLQEVIDAEKNRVGGFL